MAVVNVRELRNHGGDVLDDVGRRRPVERDEAAVAAAEALVHRADGDPRASRDVLHRGRRIPALGDHARERLEDPALNVRVVRRCCLVLRSACHPWGRTVNPHPGPVNARPPELGASRLDE